MNGVEEFAERLDELMGCSEEDLSNCIAKRKNKEIKKSVG